jgi:hypothetical protein
MKYYGTQESMSALIAEVQRGTGPVDTDECVAIKHGHGLKNLGWFSALRGDAFWTSHSGLGGKDEKFKASPEVLDFFMNSGVLQDSKSTPVRIYGRTESGRIVEAVAVNLIGKC